MGGFREVNRAMIVNKIIEVSRIGYWLLQMNVTANKWNKHLLIEPTGQKAQC